jgi:outer membrane protein
MGRFPRAAVAAVILGAIGPVAATVRAESLADAWAIALRVNQGLSAQQSLSVSAGLSEDAARRARLPTVRTQNYDFLLANSPATRTPFGSSSSGGSSGTGSGSSSSLLAAVPPYFHVLGPNQNDLPVSFTLATLPLYTGGRLLRNIDAATQQVHRQRTAEFRTALDLKLTVAEAYVSILRTRKALETARSNVEALASFARDTANRRAQGLAIRSDELAAEVSLANAQLTEIRARTDLESAWSTYNRYLCRPLWAVVEIEELADLPAGADWAELAHQAIRANAEASAGGDAEVADLIQTALRVRPELAGLTAEARGLGAQAEATLANIRPQVGVSGGFAYIGAQNFAPQGNGLLMASATWNLTDGGATRRQSASIRERERAALKQRSDLAADVALQVRTRWLTLRQARLSVPVARFAVVQSEENIRVVTDRYRQQLSTYTEVLDAETRRITSLNNFYNALYDESLALFRLRRAVGDL